MTDASNPLDPRKVLETALESLPGAADGVPTAEQIDAALPNYTVESLIGRGGMAAVYRARDEKLGRAVAIKVLQQPSDDPGFPERFRREARVLAQLDHPGILTLFDFGEAGGYSYLVTEFVDGSNLRALLSSTPPPVDDVVAIVEQVCAALGHAHGRGLVHRDIKPENILIDGTGRARLADFGLVQLTDQPDQTVLTATRESMGTLHYMAPEQLERPETVDARSDIYSLGVVAYELLTGRLPLGRFELPSTHQPAAQPLDDTILRCLASDPSDRFASAAELGVALAASRGDAAQMAVRYGENELHVHARASILYLSIPLAIYALVAYSLWSEPATSGQRVGLALGGLAAFFCGHAVMLTCIDVEWLGGLRFPGCLHWKWRTAYEIGTRFVCGYCGLLLIALATMFGTTPPVGRAIALVLSGVITPLMFLGVTKLRISPVWRAALYEASRQHD